VSPIVIDIEQAVQSSRVATMMELVNAQRPQLGVSFIETDLTLHKIVRHLRKFIYVLTEAETELTLRFADGAVLPYLASVLTAEQWTSMTAPFKSWKIHDRDGNLVSLPISVAKDEASLPLLLSDAQILALKDAAAADQLLLNLRMQRPAPVAVYSTSEAHEYARQSWNMWRVAGNADDADLIFFAGLVFDTRGGLLRVPGLAETLAQTDRLEFRSAMWRMVAT
jgi:hypothetical protein